MQISVQLALAWKGMRQILRKHRAKSGDALEQVDFRASEPVRATVIFHSLARLATGQRQQMLGGSLAIDQS